MDDPQSVEADNNFSTRRMTRSALKRALEPLESDPEQKKLISDQNLGVSKQKPGVVEEGIRGSSKQKPGGLSKTSENQQQQHHRKRNDDNQHQQSQRKEGRDRRGKSLTGQKRRRIIQRNSGRARYGLIRPVKQSIDEQLVIEKCSKSAIAIYNKEHKTKCRFVEVIRANFKLGSGIFYCITFVAEDKDVGSARNFQAFVRYQFEKITVQFCRLEKPPNESLRVSLDWEVRHAPKEGLQFAFIDYAVGEILP